MVDLEFEGMLNATFAAELMGVALIDRHGRLIASRGEIERPKPLASFVMHEHRSDDLATRMLDGEILTASHADREIAVCIAKRQLFVVAVLGPAQLAERKKSLMIVDFIRARASAMLDDHGGSIDVEPWRFGGGSGGSGSGPADLPLIEFGITVPKPRGIN